MSLLNNFLVRFKLFCKTFFFQNETEICFQREMWLKIVICQWRPARSWCALSSQEPQVLRGDRKSQSLPWVPVDQMSSVDLFNLFIVCSSAVAPLREVLWAPTQQTQEHLLTTAADREAMHKTTSSISSHQQMSATKSCWTDLMNRHVWSDAKTEKEIKWLLKQHPQLDSLTCRNLLLVDRLTHIVDFVSYLEPRERRILILVTKNGDKKRIYDGLLLLFGQKKLMKLLTEHRMY